MVEVSWVSLYDFAAEEEGYNYGFASILYERIPNSTFEAQVIDWFADNVTDLNGKLVPITLNWKPKTISTKEFPTVGFYIFMNRQEDASLFRLMFDVQD